MGCHRSGRVECRLTSLLLLVPPLFVLLGADGVDNHSGILLVLVDGPVEDVVVLEALTDEEITEDLAEIRVVGLVIEAERAGVVEVNGKLVGEAAAENLGWGGHLLLHDAIVLLLLGGSLEALPGKGAAAEVEHDVAKRLHVITARLFCDVSTQGCGVIRTDAQMGVDGGITGSTSQVLVLTVWDVEVSLGVAVLLGQAKVDHVDLVAALADAHEEVVGLDVTVDEGLGMDVFDAGDKLIGEEKHRLERELAVAEVEQILQAGAEEVEDHGIVVALGAEPADERDTDASGQRLVDTGLIFELGVLGLDALELDGDLLTGDDVGS